MLYYLDTNALYSIRKIKQQKISSCFTSIMSVLELVSGINNDNYKKRKAILGMILSFRLTIDYAFPEEIIANSFDVFEEYEFIESRVEALMALVFVITEANEYEHYRNSKPFDSELGHQFFKSLDDDLSKNFSKASLAGIKQVKEFQRSPSPENVITIDGTTFDLNTRDGLEKALPLFSLSATIEAMCHMIQGISRVKLPIKDIFSSYNQLTNIYIQVFSKYCEDQILNGRSPSKNDALDLMHLLYLKNDFKRYIVSDDKIFSKYFPNNTLALESMF
jgi:hypothetical protein